MGVTRVYTFFFFQAEDGIRDIGVTGVQTCALDLTLTVEAACRRMLVAPGAAADLRSQRGVDALPGAVVSPAADEIGRASGRERVEISVVARSLKKKSRVLGQRAQLEAPHIYILK